MADLLSWTDLSRWLFSLRRVLPDRLLRLAWSERELIKMIRVFPAAEPTPYLFVRVERGSPELEQLGFHVLNLTPFSLSIVAASGSVMLDSHVLFVHDQRFATEVRLPPFETATFHIRHSLSEPQADRLRHYQLSSARIRMDGQMVLRTPFGERLKSLVCDVDARIDR
jgi:hypothetical protein